MENYGLPPHIEETVRAIVKLQAKHNDEATPFQRLSVRTADFLGSPLFFTLLASVVGLWVTINLFALSAKRIPFDTPPFGGLQLIISLFALSMTILIFAKQQRDEKIAGHHQRLTLQLAMVNEQKSAKIIQLLEDLRRDSPFVRDRIDEEAVAMATPSDPQVVFEAIQEAHGEEIFTEPAP